MNRPSKSALTSTVYLVGAGPGTLELLTLRAYALIESATCILHDDLISVEVLSLAAPDAIVQNVGKRCGTKSITQQQINTWMIDYAAAGHSVIRLKSGDPLLFGRAAEEIAALANADVPFEVVPGVSTGSAAAAAEAFSLTGRITNSRVLFATRHLAQGSTNGLGGVTPEATLVLYMPGRDYAAIQGELLSNGWSPLTQCIVASCLGAASEQRVRCLLQDLSTLGGLPSPTVMLFFPHRKQSSALNSQETPDGN
jgi:uroporphyrin-III C-methyltransferase